MDCFSWPDLPRGGALVATDLVRGRREAGGEAEEKERACKRKSLEYFGWTQGINESSCRTVRGVFDCEEKGAVSVLASQDAVLL